MTDLRGKLIVSCQADPGDAFYGKMDSFAQAAVAGGAAGIRANGAVDVRAIRAAVGVPIIGIWKRPQSDGKVLITSTFEDAAALVEAGADAVALDCTRRGRESGAFERLRRIRAELGVPVLADIATLDEALQAEAAGADYALSTMRGYTDETADVKAFDSAFIGQLAAALRIPVIAEGRVETPAQAAAAMRSGAYAVVVGSALTRPHLATASFVRAVERAASVRDRAPVLGIDMGGTNTKFGAVTPAGELLWERTAPTPAQAGRAGLLDHLVRVAREGILHSQNVAGVGVATAGWVNPSTGCVAYATENLPGWTGAPLAQTIQQATGLPVAIENDANALAAGEAAFGAGRGLSDFVCITLGTGVGGGAFVGGRLNRGAHFFANAFGHMSIRPGGRACNCGQTGCLETYANAAALLEHGGGKYASVEELIIDAQQGNPQAVSAVRQVAEELAIGCALLVQLLDPQAIILSGGVAQNNPLLARALEENLRPRVSVWEQRNLRVVASPLGYHGGVFGAAAVAFEAAALPSGVG